MCRECANCMSTLRPCSWVTSCHVLQEYTGIDFKRLEQMELRLKNDILQESKSYRCSWPRQALKAKHSPHDELP